MNETNNHTPPPCKLNGRSLIIIDYCIFQGGLSSWDDYPYCCGAVDKKPVDNCDPCPAPGYNTSQCGPPVPYCNMTQSCVAKLDKNKFVKGLKVGSWKAIDKVCSL